jgi:hypothetical protein
LLTGDPRNRQEEQGRDNTLADLGTCVGLTHYYLQDLRQLSSSGTVRNIPKTESAGGPASITCRHRRVGGASFARYPERSPHAFATGRQNSLASSDYHQSFQIRVWLPIPESGTFSTVRKLSSTTSTKM